MDLPTPPPAPPTEAKKSNLIQRVIQQKAKIIRAWIGLYGLLTIGVILAFVLPPMRGFWYEIGEKTGTLAVLLLSLTLVPGIIRRMGLRGFWLQVQLPLMVFRRHLGISMYLAATCHVLFAKTFPMVAHGLPLSLSPFEIAGAVALLLTTPLFLTSNDLAVARLGKIWKKIHTLVYGIALFVLIHLVLLGGVHPITFIAFGTIILEAVSWINVWYRAKRMIPAIVLVILTLMSSTAFASYTYNAAKKSPILFERETLMMPRNGAGGNYSNALVATHSTPTDCWSIIHGKIYNLSSYVAVHPGGVETIRTACGVDGTTAFETKGGLGRSHLPSTNELLNAYFVANLGDPLPASDQISPGDNQSENLLVAPTSGIPITTSETLDAAKIALHNTATSCWLNIGGSVYDVTQYIPYHPGGREQILKYCGKESTSAFYTKGGIGSDHTGNAKSILASLRIGSLNESNVTVLTPKLTQTPSPTTIPTPAPTTSTQALTTDTVASHNTQSNCWLIINGSVYDVTQYIPYHPGGTQQIVINCGKESTTAFNTKGGGGGNHSSSANATLGNYKIGTLGSSATSTPVPTTPPAGGSTPTVIPTPAPTTTTQTLTTSVVATHATQSDCWLIINNTVYDVTQYIPYHPGGTQQIVINCGKESTTAFNTKGGGGGNHSSSANATLGNYKIGTLGATVTPTPSPTPTPIPTGSPITLTAATVATHNTQGNCWLIINGSVYDVTQYIPFHPGGISQITTYCGKESTTAFNTKGGRGNSHSGSANTTLANYKIGTLGATVTPTPTTLPTGGPTLTPRPRRRHDD